MIDLPLMAKLVEAVPDGARLVLLGDPDQLPSVEAGDVLSGILAAADNVSDGGSTSPASGRGRAKGAGEGALRSVENTPPPAGAPPALPAHPIPLTRTYRQTAPPHPAPHAPPLRQRQPPTTPFHLPPTHHPAPHFHHTTPPT